jgi:hypothetical protein
MLRFTVDDEQISEASRVFLRLTGQYEWTCAMALTRAARTARQAIADQTLPGIDGGPTAWTRRGLMSSMARPDNLVANVGFNYGDGSFAESGFTGKGGGVPSGRYMGVLARGGDRQPKASELRLRRAGVIRSDQFVTPASSGIRINPLGNVAGSEYQRILSRLKAEQEGSDTATRSKGKRAQTDYFVRYGELGEGAMYIAKRIGRGFVPALFVVEQPNYEGPRHRPWFDIQGIATRAFKIDFPIQFQKQLDIEIARRS